MSSLTDVEQAVANLSPEEFSEFELWFNTERNRRWDSQFDADEGESNFLLQEPPSSESPSRP